MNRQQRQSLAYWLTLAFRLEREPRRAINGLVLTADRRCALSLLDLVQMVPDRRPPEVARYAATLDRLIDAEGRVSAQAFLVERVVAMGGRFIPITDPSYPTHFVQRIGADRAPTVLTVVGDPALFAAAGVAVSGSRKAGPMGLAFARQAGRAVAEAGAALICGLAAGVDREALEGALEAGGRAIGIAPEGILRSRWLHSAALQAGKLVIVSEFAPDDAWTAGRAMARNRTIAGFSRALVIADCVASGGTTDQLEVHRDAGMPVYVRRGPGQGALVDELCKRPGITPWDWSSGPVHWPPPPTDEITCRVDIESNQVSIHVEAPRQLDLQQILGRIEEEYLRAATPSGPAVPPSASEPLVSYSVGVQDPVLTALERAGSDGLTVAELERELSASKAKLRKRLAELRDAKLVTNGARRHSYVFGSPSAATHAATAELELFPSRSE